MKPYWKRRRRGVARARVDTLLDIAIETYPTDLSLAETYVRRALAICQRYRVRRPLLLRRLYCRSCKSPIFPGRTSRVRVRPNQRHLALTCLRCGSTMRIPLGERRLRGEPEAGGESA